MFWLVLVGAVCYVIGKYDLEIQIYYGVKDGIMYVVEYIKGLIKPKPKRGRPKTK